MERRARCELAGVLRERYRQSDKGAKSKILDEFVAITGHHRKYAVRLLNKAPMAFDRSPPGARRIYGEAVKETLILLWEASRNVSTCMRHLLVEISVFWTRFASSSLWSWGPAPKPPGFS